MFMHRERVYQNSYMLTVFPENDVVVREEGNFVMIRYVGVEVGRRILVSVVRV